MCIFAACNKEEQVTEKAVPSINVTSESINQDGRLLTITAADHAPNDPLGKNQSPELSWEAVDEANSYAVCMFDTDANWLHWMVTNVEATSVKQGEFDNTVYVGPYPPKGSGEHTYQIEVFALKEAANKKVGKLDAKNTYKTLIDELNKTEDGTSNIIGRGTISGKFANGDNTQ